MRHSKHNMVINKGEYLILPYFYYKGVFIMIIGPNTTYIGPWMDRFTEKGIDVGELVGIIYTDAPGTFKIEESEFTSDEEIFELFSTEVSANTTVPIDSLSFSRRYYRFIYINQGTLLRDYQVKLSKKSGEDLDSISSGVTNEVVIQDEPTLIQIGDSYLEGKHTVILSNTKDVDVYLGFGGSIEVGKGLPLLAGQEREFKVNRNKKVNLYGVSLQETSIIVTEIK